MASVTDGAMKKGAHAGNLIKAIAGLVGGGGGGRPNMAQAGGKNPSGIAAALEKAAEVVAEQVKSKKSLKKCKMLLTYQFFYDIIFLVLKKIPIQLY